MRRREPIAERACRETVDARKLFRAERHLAVVAVPDPMAELREFRREVEHLVLLVHRADCGKSLGHIRKDAEHADNATIARFRRAFDDDRAHFAVGSDKAQIEFEAGALRRGLLQLALCGRAVVGMHTVQAKRKIWRNARLVAARDAPHMRGPRHLTAGDVPVPVAHVADVLGHGQQPRLAVAGCQRARGQRAGRRHSRPRPTRDLSRDRLAHRICARFDHARGWFLVASNIRVAGILSNPFAGTSLWKTVEIPHACAPQPHLIKPAASTVRVSRTYALRGRSSVG